MKWLAAMEWGRLNVTVQVELKIPYEREMYIVEDRTDTSKTSSSLPILDKRQKKGDRHPYALWMFQQQITLDDFHKYPAEGRHYKWFLKQNICNLRRFTHPQLLQVCN